MALRLSTASSTRFNCQRLDALRIRSSYFAVRFCSSSEGSLVKASLITLRDSWNLPAIINARARTMPRRSAQSAPATLPNSLDAFANSKARIGSPALIRLVQQLTTASVIGWGAPVYAWDTINSRSAVARATTSFIGRVSRRSSWRIRDRGRSSYSAPDGQAKYCELILAQQPQAIASFHSHRFAAGGHIRVPHHRRGIVVGVISIDVLRDRSPLRSGAQAGGHQQRGTKCRELSGALHCTTPAEIPLRFIGRSPAKRRVARNKMTSRQRVGPATREVVNELLVRLGEKATRHPEPKVLKPSNDKRLGLSASCVKRNLESSTFEPGLVGEATSSQHKGPALPFDRPTCLQG